jgi:hypothetical protein
MNSELQTWEKASRGSNLRMASATPLTNFSYRSCDKTPVDARNGTFRSHLDAGSNNGYSNHTLTFDDADLADGMNFVTFEEGNAGWQWGLDQFEFLWCSRYVSNC